MRLTSSMWAIPRSTVRPLLMRQAHSIRPAELNLDDMDIEAARRTRSVIMFLGPLMRFYDTFKLPYATRR
jgi:hypothetical protein